MTDRNGPGPGFYGKFRGVVANNQDPLARGRLLLLVPDVLGLETSTWALPCVPLAGVGNGFFALPEVGAKVWVEFEQGDVDFPVWVGGFWDQGDTPPLAALTSRGTAAITLQTAGQHGLTISDMAGDGGGIRIVAAGGATLVVNDSGITIDNGQGAVITLTGSTVNINNGALEVD